MRKVLVGILIILLAVIGLELMIIFVNDKKQANYQTNLPLTSSEIVNTTQSKINNAPVETGLLSSYIYFFEVRDQEITKKGVISGEYEGVVNNIDFVKDQQIVFKFNGFNGWFSLYKKPNLFQETKCQVFDNATTSYIDYGFAELPFKEGDKVNLIYDIDYKNRAIFCKIKIVG